MVKALLFEGFKSVWMCFIYNIKLYRARGRRQVKMDFRSPFQSTRMALRR